MAMTPTQQAEYNSLLGKRNAYNKRISDAQYQLDEAQKNYNAMPSNPQYQSDIRVYKSNLDAAKTQGEGYLPWETARMNALESGDQSNKSEFQAAMAGVPEVPKVDFSELLRRRQVGTPEYNAQKAQMALGEQRQSQLAQRQLLAAQAKAGVRGGAAGAQQERLQEQTGLQRAAAEQGLYAKNIGEREKLEKAQQFGDVSSQLARMQLASADLGQQRGLSAAQNTAAAQMAAAAGQGGCCMIVAITTSVLGISQAEADEMIQKSKSSIAHIYKYEGKNNRFVSELNATRKIRDTMCSVSERRGYYQLADILAPSLEKHPLLAKTLYHSFVKPGVSCVNGTAGFISKAVVKTWIKFFGLIAQAKPYTRSNGEVV